MKKLISLFFGLLVTTSLLFGQANGLAITNKASGGAIGTAAATVDVASLFNVAQTTAGQTLTVPNLTNATNGKTIHVNNTGSVAFTLLSKTIEPGTGILLRWTGSAWNISGVGNATGGGGSGDIEGVTAGVGLTGGGTTGTVTLNADTTNTLATQYDISLKVDKSGSKVLTDVNFSAGDKSKLDGIASGATANATNAELRDRSTHTGEQAISTVTGLQGALDAKVNLPVRESMADANKTYTTGYNQVYTSATFTAPRTLTLPAASSVPAGTELLFTDQFGAVSTTNYLTVLPNGPDVIGGSSSFVYSTTNGLARFISDGVSSWIVSASLTYSSGTWIPTFTGFSADPTGVIATYTRIGKQVTIAVYMVAGTSNANTFTLTAPFASKNINYIAIGAGVDATNFVYPRVRMRSNSNIIDVFRDNTATTWGTTSSKAVYFTLTYEMP